jgi:hypothetical protein
MNDERCDLLCLDAPRAEAIRVGLPGIEAVGEAAKRARMFSDPTRLVLAAALGKVRSYVFVIWPGSPLALRISSPTI